MCGDPATAIHTIQGTGNTSPMNGATNVAIEGVVVGDYQGTGQFGGYYVQEEDADADADPLTSEGIFVFNTSFAVAAGDRVRVRGNVTEFTTGGVTLTELVNGQPAGHLSGRWRHASPPPRWHCPSPSVSDWERYEGMRDLAVADD